MKEGKNIVILGAGESGIGAALLAKGKNLSPFVSDNGKISEKNKRELVENNIPFEEQGHSMDRIGEANLIIKSPGIPDNAAIIKKATAPVISEIEFASRYTNGKIVGITGSNGKTTTTHLTWHMLKSGGLDVQIAGNMGQSFARMLSRNDHDLWVLELSSFQLDGVLNLRNFISIILNITEDHLDRYDYNFQNYVNSKFRITMNQTEDDYFIYNFDDPVIKYEVEKRNIPAKKIPISQETEIFPGAFIKDKKMTINLNEEKMDLDTKDFSLQGKHNNYNSMAAGVVGKILQVRKETIRESLKSFKNLEHRLEEVARIQGTLYINDSKGTNLNATWYALESMDRPVIWIAGGIDKGNDYNSIAPLVKSKVKALICLGKDNSKIRSGFELTLDNIFETQSMEEAVKIAASIADKEDVVLLSPACASFDLFENFEDRGRKFKKAVLAL